MPYNPRFPFPAGSQPLPDVPLPRGASRPKCRLEQACAPKCEGRRDQRDCPEIRISKRTRERGGIQPEG
eukprot:6209367-Pleurochrysis_carterae.AAC.1